MADCHHVLEEKWWIYLVRSLGFQPKPSSHDWHVQPSCQRTDPLPPERALSVQSRYAFTRASRDHTNLPVLETCTNYAFATITVNPLLAQDFHLFSTARGAKTLIKEELCAHATKRIFHLQNNAYAISAQAEAEEHQFEKRSLGGFCEKRIQPFEEPCPRM